MPFERFCEVPGLRPWRWPLQASLARDVGTGDASTPFAMRAGLVAVSPDYFATLKTCSSCLRPLRRCSRWSASTA
jgi:hypothetical protein